MTKKLLAFAMTVCMILLNSSFAFASENRAAAEPAIVDEVQNVANPEIQGSMDVQEVYEEIAPIENIKSMEPNIMEREYSGSNVKVSSFQRKSSSINSALAETDNTEPNNTEPNNAYLVENEDVFQGSILTSNEMRWYGFTLDEKSKVSILLQMVSNLDADLYMFQLDTSTYSLELIGGSANAGNGVQEWYNDVLEAGIYYFAVSGYSGVGDFAFAFYNSTIDVNYEVNDSTDTATPIAFNTNITGVIDSPYDTDIYKFTITKPMVIRYSITGANGYEYGFSQGVGSTAYTIQGNLTKFLPGTHYFLVRSLNGTYSSEQSYTINFNKIADLANDSSANYLAISEGAKIVFQTDAYGSNCYVNGNPIDLSYSYYKNASNSAGSQVYNITMTQNSDIFAKIYESQYAEYPEMQQVIPDTVYYHYGSKSNMPIQNKHLLELSVSSPSNFYNINCSRSGAYRANNLYLNVNYATVLIDPDTGKLVDISFFNYFYDYAVGSNSMLFTRPYSMKYYYPYYNGEEPYPPY